jgi:pimeloyl-ACP methyl ester carboxylesterase
VNPVVMTVTLVTQDGVLIDAVHLPPPGRRGLDEQGGAGQPADLNGLADLNPLAALDGLSDRNGRAGRDVLAGRDGLADGNGDGLAGRDGLADGDGLAPPRLPPGMRDLAIVIAHGFTMSWQRPLTWSLVRRFNHSAGVVTFDFRGHGRSGGLSTLGDKEIDDLDVAVRYARELGYQRVATVGFSMGGSVVLRHAALRGGTDAVISVSSPGRWYYRGTVAMRRVHLAAERRLGRAFSKRVLNTRISPAGWPVPDPMPPAEAASRISPTPVLIIHGDQDIYFPADHGQQLYDAAKEPKELWLIRGFGHAERHTDDALVDRIVAWADTASAEPYRDAEQTTS